MPTVLITGANRGLGLEFVRQYNKDGWRIVAGCRDPENAAQLRSIGGDVAVHKLDVENHEDIDHLAKLYRGDAIDVLINNAGVLGDPARQAFGKMDYDDWRRVLNVNVLAPAKVSHAFHEHVAQSEQRKIVVISSALGSITRADGVMMVYRTSKAAVNMVVKGMASELGERGITVIATHPGWVRTDMGGSNADISPNESVTGLRKVISGITTADNGAFIQYDGERLPW